MIQDKYFQRIGEVAEQVGVPTHVLRYWEAEFPQLRPKKGSGGQRLYCSEDIRLISEIKTLLYSQGMTIEGARKVLSKGKTGGPSAADIERVAKELRQLAKSL